MHPVQQPATHHLVVDSVRLLGEGLVDAVVLDLVNTKDQRLLERPCGDVARELLVAGLDAPTIAVSYN